jgi:hypothetical protein
LATKPPVSSTANGKNSLMLKSAWSSVEGAKFDDIFNCTGSMEKRDATNDIAGIENMVLLVLRLVVVLEAKIG